MKRSGGATLRRTTRATSKRPKEATSNRPEGGTSNLARSRWPAAGLIVILITLSAPAAGAHDHPDDGLAQPDPEMTERHHDPSDAQVQLDAQQESLGHVVSEGPSAHVTKNLEMVGHGERLLPEGTTDVWALDGYAYIGTFNEPCGTGEGFGEDTLIDDREQPGIAVYDVRNRNRPSYVGNLPSVEGSRSNDVKVDTMNSGDVLVHSNEACAGGPGGFEIYDVDDPRQPAHLASVRVDDANQVLRETFGSVDLGVHNLFLFTQGDRDYVALQTHAFFGGLQIFDITDPGEPDLVTTWGAELLCEGDFCSDDPYNETDIGTLLAHINGYMFCDLDPCFGFSQNRFLHDVTVSADGTMAYLSHWDAGLILLDISDVSDPELVSVALDPEEGSLDGEVNSHAAWPSEDGTVVVETEEDFDAWVTILPPTSLTFGDDDPPAPLPGTAVATGAGDAFELEQTGNAGTVDGDALIVDEGPLAGEVYPAIELAGNQPKIADVGPVEGDIVWIGQGCDADPILNDAEIADGGIAVARRGGCTFREKNLNAATAGADAVVIANNVEDDTAWGGVRIWDYSDPANPVLASTFNTECSAAFEPICDPRGTWSVHNVIVERDKAYFSWYSDGVLVVDISDPYNPVEVARWHQAGPEWEEANGGIQDVWGIFKERGRPWIYASDRNGGLYILQERGAGSANRGPR